MVAVVSYGPNGVPGAAARTQNGVYEPTRVVSDEQRAARLYFDAAAEGVDYRIPEPADYTVDPLTDLRTLIVRDPDPAAFPAVADPFGGDPYEVVGILDPGSDDIVFRF